MKKQENTQATQEVTQEVTQATQEVTALTIGEVKVMTFKNPKLTEETTLIAEEYRKAYKSQKEICKHMWIIERDKLYKDDGFKSLKEFAESVNIPDKSTAHKLADAGKVYMEAMEGTEAERELAEKSSWSALAMMRSAGKEEIKKAAESGELKPTMTVKEVENWKESKGIKKAKKSLKNGPVLVTTMAHFEGVVIPCDETKEPQRFDYKNAMEKDVVELQGYEKFTVTTSTGIVHHIGFNPNILAFVYYNVGNPITPEMEKAQSQNALLEKLSALSPDALEKLMASLA